MCYESIISIRKLEQLKDQALEEYHTKCRAIDSRIEQIRIKRGTKLTEPDYTGYHEPGRDREIKNGNW